MGLEVAIAATVLSTLSSVAGTLEDRKAVKEEAKHNARVERRNSVQQQVDLEHNKSVEKSNRKEAVMQGAHTRRQIMRKGKINRAQQVAQAERQGLTPDSPSIDSVLANQAFEEELALIDAKYEQSAFTTSSRGRSRALTRDAFAVREIGETNAQATIAAGENRARSLGLSAIGQGFDGASKIGKLFI